MARRRPALIWSPEAQTDLSAIWDHYATVAGRDRADAVVREISDVSLLIEDHPFAGRARDEIRPGLRSVAARPYILFIGSVMTSLRSFGYCTVGATWMRFSALVRAIYDDPTHGQRARDRFV
jgi:plasmid stabilization system protein ParE